MVVSVGEVGGVRHTDPSFRLTDPFWWWEEDCVWEEDCPSHDPHKHQPNIFWDGSYRDPTQWWQYACEE